MTFSKKIIRTVIFIEKGIYLSIAILLVLLTLLAHDLQLILYSVASLVIYYGLHKVKYWTIPIIIFLNFIGVLTFFFESTDYSRSIPAPVSWVFLCFTILAIFFYAKKEVKDYFKKGK